MAAAVALALLASCGGGDGKSSVPTVTFAGGGSDAGGSSTGASSPSTTAGAGGAATSAPSTTAAASTSTSTSAGTGAPPTTAGAATSPTTGTLAALPPGYTEVTVDPVDPAAAAPVLAGYQAFQSARRAVLVTPTAPPWDALRAATIPALFTSIQSTYQALFDQGQGYVYQGEPVSRAKVVDLRGDQVAVVEDCVTAWGYRIDVASGQPLPGQEADVAGPTNTAYRAFLTLDGGVWKMSSYDTGAAGACVGV